jgi:hypothetical protein
MAEQAVVEKEQDEVVTKNRGGRPIGAKNKEEYAIVVWRYTLSQYREEWDPETDSMVLKEVEDFEKKTYKERVRSALVKQDGCFKWESDRNDKLAKARKKNRIRVINWYIDKNDGSDKEAVDGEKDGLKTAIQNAGETNG